MYSVIIPIDLSRRPYQVLSRLFRIISVAPNEIEIVIAHNYRGSMADWFLRFFLKKKINVRLTSERFYTGGLNMSLLRNRAVDISTKDIVLLLDVDIVFDEELFCRAYKLVLNKKTPLVMLPCLYLTKKGNKLAKKNDRKELYRYYLGYRRDLFQHIASPSSVMMFYKEDYYSVGQFDENFVGHGYEDFDFMMRFSYYHDLIKTSKEWLIDKPYRSCVLSEGFRKHLGAISLPFFFDEMVVFHLYHKKSVSDKYYLSRKRNQKIFLNKMNKILLMCQCHSGSLDLIDLYKKLCFTEHAPLDKFGVLLDCRDSHFDRHDTFVRKLKCIIN